MLAPVHLAGTSGRGRGLPTMVYVEGSLSVRFGINFQVEAALSDQGCKGNAGPACFRLYLAVNRNEIFGLAAEALCSEFDECFTRRRGSLPNLHATALDTARPGGPPLIRGEGCIALHIFDFFYADAEFFGRHFSDGNPQALPQINLAAEYRHGAIAIHGKETVHLLRIEDAWRTAAILCEKINATAARCKGDGERATLEDGAAGHTRRPHGDGHLSLPHPTRP